MRFTNFRLAMAACVVLAACAPPTKRGPTPYDRTVKSDCYTVDLFTPATIQQPAADVPTAWRAFAGKWGGGAWEGKWCHDLYVLSIGADGKVDLIETHAPFPEWGREATAFRRQGFMTDDGTLRLIYKNVAIEYRIEGGKLLGVRKEGGGEMRIKLSQQSAA